MHASTFVALLLLTYCAVQIVHADECMSGCFQGPCVHGISDDECKADCKDSDCNDADDGVCRRDRRWDPVPNPYPW
ncbi:hypothetical protein AAVH_28552 [Aphelenchoides avenae]|nr:hypothetical protein AAVH_28552 [Aphelenchus avenae]